MHDAYSIAACRPICQLVTPFMLQLYFYLMLLYYCLDHVSKTCGRLSAASQQPVDPRKGRAAPGAAPNQPSPQPVPQPFLQTGPGAFPSQPLSNGPAGMHQPWRPSPSFRDQHQGLPGPSTSQLPPIPQLITGRTAGPDPRGQGLTGTPQDPRRGARPLQQSQAGSVIGTQHLQQHPQQQLQQQQSVGGFALHAGQAQAMNGIHAQAPGQGSTAPGAAVPPVQPQVPASAGEVPKHAC